MGDNLTTQGKTFRTDELPGEIHVPFCKIDIGADGLSVPLEGGQQAMAESVPVVIASDQPAIPVSLSGSATAANQATEISALATVITHVDGVEALLTAIDGHVDGLETPLSSIDTKTPALGQALAAASVPVVLTAAQLSTLTPPAAIAGFATAANQASIIAQIATLLSQTDGLEGFTDGVEALLAAATPAGENIIGKVVGVIDNPTSTLTRVNDTNAYSQNDLIATNTSAGSVVVPSVSVLRLAAGSALLRRFRLITNKTSGWDAAQLRIRFWSTAPTYANGDNGAYSVSTGAAGFLGKSEVTLEQFGDGAAGVGIPSVGSELGIKLASGQVIYWDVQYIGTASLSPASGQTFTLIPESLQN